MKKLLLIMLCLITLTGCGNEVEQQPTESPTKQEEVEVNKYITIKLTLNEDCNTEKNDSCKVEKFTIENDKDNIFKDLDLSNTTYCGDVVKCNTNTRDTSVLSKIYDIAKVNNMNLIMDFKNTGKERNIVIKPLEDLKWDGKINLNENVQVLIETEVYNEYEEHCMQTSKEFGKSMTPTKCGPTENGYPGGIKRKISNELINQVNSTPGRKYEGKGKDSLLNYETIIISKIFFGYNPRFLKEMPTKFFDNKEVIDDIQKINYINTFNISTDMDSTPTKSEVKILDEKICEEYNLVCDRW